MHKKNKILFYKNDLIISKSSHKDNIHEEQIYSLRNFDSLINI